MKQHFPIALVILSLLVALVGIAAAPPSSGVIRLVSVQYVPNKGPVFTFEVSGKFPRSALKGIVYVQGGGNYPLYCTQVDENTVKCSTSQKVSDINVSLTWGGSTFWTYVPEAPTPPTPPSGPTRYCYSIWDWWDFTDNQWTDFGPHCQDVPAKAGDTTTYTVPSPLGSFESDPVDFYEEDVSKCEPPAYNGPAYYYPGCPGGGGGGGT